MGTNAALRRRFRHRENKTTILSYPERMVASVAALREAAGKMSALVVDQQRRERGAAAARSSCRSRRRTSMTRPTADSCNDCRNCFRMSSIDVDARRGVSSLEDASSEAADRRAPGGGPPAPPGPPASPAGAVGERRLEDALQFGGLIAGQLAAGNFAGDQVVDLRFQVVGRRPRAAGLVAGAAGLHARNRYRSAPTPARPGRTN